MRKYWSQIMWRGDTFWMMQDLVASVDFQTLIPLPLEVGVRCEQAQQPLHMWSTKRGCIEYGEQASNWVSHTLLITNFRHAYMSRTTCTHYKCRFYLQMPSRHLHFSDIELHLQCDRHVLLPSRHNPWFGPPRFAEIFEIGSGECIYHCVCKSLWCMHLNI